MKTSNIIFPKVTNLDSTKNKRTFMQVHTFYEHYLKNNYLKNPQLISGNYHSRISELTNDGFSGIHMIAPYIHEAGYEGQLIIANDLIAQMKWLMENDVKAISDIKLNHAIVKAQIDYYKPEILYLSDPIEFDSKFIRSLDHKPKLILGWRAANIPNYVDWTEFDIILSNLSSLREEALKFGAKSAEHFWPGFPLWYYEKIKNIEATYDLGFTGSWTTKQHQQRNKYIEQLAFELKQRNMTFALHLSGELDQLPANVKQSNLGEKYGLDMFIANRSARMIFDARGNIGVTDEHSDLKDLARKETANMRIIEVTGCGRLLITEDYENLSTLFEVGKEIVTYKSASELNELIKYYGSNKQEAQAIAERGRERCHREHSMEIRVGELAKIIERHLLKVSPEVIKNYTIITKSPEKEPEYKMQKLDREIVHAEILSHCASMLLDGTKTKAALMLLEDIDEKLKHCPALALLKGLALVREGRYDESVQILNKVLSIYPTYQQAKQLLAAIAREFLLDVKYTQKEKSSNEILEELIETISNSLDNKKFEEALVLIQKALVFDPNSKNILAAKALTHYHLNQYLEAVSTAKICLNLDPSNPSMLNLIEDIDNIGL